MGQIVGINSTIFRCNLRAIQSGGTKANSVLAADEVWLVDTTNSLTDSFSGNCDCYIVGNGSTAATGLELKKISLSSTDIADNLTNPKEYGAGYAAGAGAVQKLFMSNFTIADITTSSGWKRNNVVELLPEHTYTITFTNSAAAGTLTYFVVYDEGGTATQPLTFPIYGPKVAELFIAEYTPSVKIVKIDYYSGSAGECVITEKNNSKKLLTTDDVVNDLMSGGNTLPLSAEMGKEINEKLYFLNYYYYPLSSGQFGFQYFDLSNNINAARGIIVNQNIASLSVRNGYKYRVGEKPDNIYSGGQAGKSLMSDYTTEKWINTSNAAYLWVLVVKDDGSVIDCNELNNILIVEYSGAKEQFNKIYTQEDLYKLGNRAYIQIDYLNGYLTIASGTRTVDESSTSFISDYIDVREMSALSFEVSSLYSASNNSPSLTVFWYDEGKNYLGHTNVQILTKDRKAILGIPETAVYAVFNNKREVEAIYRQNAVNAQHNVSYKSVLTKLKKVSLVICHGQSLMVGADSTTYAQRKSYYPLICFAPIENEGQTADSKYTTFRTLGPLYGRESPRLGIGEMFIQTISKENNINVDANEWDEHLLLLPNIAIGDSSIETLSNDTNYAKVEAVIRNAKRLCDDFGYELSAPAWVWFQGEGNIGNTSKDTYKNALLALHERICNSLSSLAGITTRPKCIIYQPSSQCILSTQAADYGYSNSKLEVPTAFAELLAGNDEFIAAAPTYILTPATSGGIYIHCDAESYNLLGAYAGYALKKYLIDGISVKGVIPLNFTVNGNTITVKYNVPSPPLCVDTNWVREVAHYGYTCVKSDGTDIVTDVSVYWDTVIITCSESPVGCKLRYGLNGDRVYSADGYYGWSGRIYGGRGNIRDNQGNAIYKEMPDGKILPMYNWAYCFEELLSE